MGLIYRLHSDFAICDIVAALLISQTLHNQVLVNVQNNQVLGREERAQGFAVI